jgi:hypothetical protein
VLILVPAGTRMICLRDICTALLRGTIIVFTPLAGAFFSGFGKARLSTNGDSFGLDIGFLMMSFGGASLTSVNRMTYLRYSSSMV